MVLEQDFAARIHPAIVAGRIRFEYEAYHHCKVYWAVSKYVAFLHHENFRYYCGASKISILSSVTVTNIVRILKAGDDQ